MLSLFLGVGWLQYFYVLFFLDLERLGISFGAFLVLILACHLILAGLRIFSSYSLGKSHLPGHGKNYLIAI